jgi:hypothetical protein
MLGGWEPLPRQPLEQAPVEQSSAALKKSQSFVLKRLPPAATSMAALTIQTSVAISCAA